MSIKRTGLVVSLMLGMFLAAVEGTIVTMAMPTISKDLQGFEIMSLVFAVYLLATALSTPIYGKLADLYGRKNILSIGVIIFLIGSFLCGLSQSMVMLILFRVFQGLGAGAIFTVSFTIIGDVFSFEERAKIQGALSMVWGIASLIGPFLGGFLILSWHWVFFINIPFGLLSVVLLQKSLKEAFEKEKHQIDYAGTVTLSLAVVALLSIFLFNQDSSAYYPLFVAGLGLLTLALLFAFYKIERKVKEPIIPFEIFAKTTVIVNLISLLIFAVLMGIDVYLPVYLQNILGHSPTVSGMAMLPMSVAWLIASLILGKLMLRHGGKAVILVSDAVLLTGTLLLLTLGINTSILFVPVYGFIMGIGFGGVTTALVVIIQDSSEFSKRGAAVGTNSLLRTLGQTIGVSMFGNIFNQQITKYFVEQGMESITPSNMYQAAASGNAISADQIILSLNSSIHVLFTAFIIIIFLSFILAMIMPGRKRKEKAL
jgi:EmrB/QacA subfamily drug resistance transporter